MSHRPVPAPLAWILTLLLLLGSLQGAAGTALAQTGTGAAAAPGIQPENMDLTVDPADDFYQFANGGWEADAELPDHLARYGPFNEVADRVDGQLLEIIDGFDTDLDTDQGKVRALYEQVLDMETRDASGVQPLERITEMTAGIDSVEEGLAFHPTAYSVLLPGLFEVGSTPMAHDATTLGPYLYGPILSLPSEDYYLDDSEEGQEIRDAWIATTTALLVHLGYSGEDAAVAAETVLALEMQLVGIKTPDAEIFSNPASTVNPRTPEELEELLPAMDWETFFDETDLPRRAGAIEVVDIAYIEGLQEVLDTLDPLALRYLYDVQLIWTYAPYLTTEIGDLAFSFSGTVILGVEEQPPMKEQALAAVQEWMPDPLAEAYVEAHLTPETIAKAEDMMDKIVAAFRIRVEHNTWMTDETKQETLEKLDMMRVGIGTSGIYFPYDDIEIGDSLAETVLNIYSTMYAQGFEATGFPVNPDIWFMEPFEVNAAYSSNRNMMIFPAAILQPPYFDPDADLASNYGALGAVMGHELIHGFDPSGAQFDGEGNLVSWWAEEDYAAFDSLTDRVVDRYSSIEFLPGLMVNGELTVTENVADLGGVQVAYDALQIAIALDGPEHGPWFLTQEQRFFVSWATIWRGIATTEFHEFLIAVDEHAPSPVRAVEPLRHMDEFYDAFDIQPDDPMYLPPEDRIVIW